MSSIIKKEILISAITVTALGTGLFGVTQVMAQKPVNTPSIVQKIADKFGLKKEDVQAVFDQDRQDHMNQMEQKYEDMLSQAVKDGKITEAQKQLIITKHNELKTQMQNNFSNWKNLTPDQRKTDMQKQKTDLETWANQNHIDLTYLFGRIGMNKGRMHRMNH